MAASVRRSAGFVTVWPRLNCCAPARETPDRCNDESSRCVSIVVARSLAAVRASLGWLPLTPAGMSHLRACGKIRFPAKHIYVFHASRRTGLRTLPQRVPRTFDIQWRGQDGRDRGQGLEPITVLFLGAPPTETRPLDTRCHSRRRRRRLRRGPARSRGARRLRRPARRGYAISCPRAAVSTGGRSLPVQVLPCVRGPHGAVHVATQAGGRGSLVHPDSGHDMGISTTRPPRASGAPDVDVSVVVADPGS